MGLFDRNLVYPRDSVGPYVELEGLVSSIEGSTPDAVEVTIETEHGPVSGWAEGPMARDHTRMEWAKIRVYDSGGGFYPDNEVVSIGWGTAR